MNPLFFSIVLVENWVWCRLKAPFWNSMLSQQNFYGNHRNFCKSKHCKGQPLGGAGARPSHFHRPSTKARMSWVGTIPVTALELHACTVVSWVILSRALCTSLLFLACVATMPIQLTVKPTPYVWEIGPAGLVVNEATIHWFWQGAVLLSNVSICSVLWLRP